MDLSICFHCGEPHLFTCPRLPDRLRAERDRERWLRFCDAWVAIGLAATLELVIDDTPPWEPPRPRGVARNAIARRLGIPAAEAK